MRMPTALPQESGHSELGVAHLGNIVQAINQLAQSIAELVETVTVPSVAFASLPAGTTGMLYVVTDSNTATWGATIAGGGANVVLAFFNGTNWTVAGA